MQIKNLAYSVNSFYFQNRLAVWLVLTVVLALLSSHGVVLADEPGTGGGHCSGC
jgi:hypothetical protein